MHDSGIIPFKFLLNVIFKEQLIIIFTGGKQSAHSDLAGDKDEFQIQTERGSSSIMQGKVVKR